MHIYLIALCDRTDESTDLGDLLARCTFPSHNRAANRETRSVDCYGCVAHITDGPADAGAAFEGASRANGRLCLGVVCKLDRAGARHAAGNATDIRIVAEGIVAGDRQLSRLLG